MNIPSVTPTRLALAVYALATPLAFPHEIPGGGSVDLGLAMAWVIPAALVLGLEGRSAREAAVSAFVASLIGHVLLFHWFYVVTVSYGGMPGAIGVLSPLAPALYVSIFTALFAAGWTVLRKSGRGSILLGAALWVGVDWARAHFLGGFPWATLGYALHLDVPLLWLTRFAGVYALSFVIAAVGIALARLRLDAGRTSRRDAVAIVVALVLAHGVLSRLVAPPDTTPAAPSTATTSHPTLRIAAVQGNIDQGQKWDEARRNLILEKYLALSEDAADAGAAWIVWPETAIPGFVELDPALAERLSEFAARRGIVLVAGGMGVAPDESGRRIGAFFDSAFVFDRKGDVVDRYDKTHLVPFGEFVPLRGWLGRFFEALATGLSSTDVTPGDRPRILVGIDGADGQAPPRVAVPICYELLFPHLMRHFGGDGAELMLAITNDAWYGRTGAPHQFLAMTAMRAAENGRFIVRAANTGISAIIDDHGRVHDRSRLFEDALVVGDVPVFVDQVPTFYARFGDVFAALCALIGVGAWTVLGARGWARERPAKSIRTHGGPMGRDQRKSRE
jgi:apolipoprotein N-acyltransferase